MNSPMNLGVSPTATSTPTGVFNQRFEALFPHAGALGSVVCFAPQLFLPVYLHENVGPPTPPAATWQDLPAAALPLSTIHHLTGSISCLLALSSPPVAALPRVFSNCWLPISAPPTSLDECVFFNSLVVELPYSSIFCQFWLFLAFKLLWSFFWLCEEAQCVYLCLHLGQKLIKNSFTCKPKHPFPVSEI